MVLCCTDETVTVYTNHTNPINQATILTGMKQLVFRLKACKHAIVALTTEPGQTDNNSWHVIIDQNVEGVHVSHIVNVDTGVRRMRYSCLNSGLPYVFNVSTSARLYLVGLVMQYSLAVETYMYNCSVCFGS